MKDSISKKILLLLSICSLFFQLDLSAQEGVQEQLHLELNKDLFIAGEMIWGKAYVQDALFEKPSQLSKYVYVELWDAQGSLIKQNKVRAEGGSGGFSMLISPEQASGNYELRAYTKWMANESSANFARKLIRIYKASEVLPLTSVADCGVATAGALLASLPSVAVCGALPAPDTQPDVMGGVSGGAGLSGPV